MKQRRVQFGVVGFVSASVALACGGAHTDGDDGASGGSAGAVVTSGGSEASGGQEPGSGGEASGGGPSAGGGGASGASGGGPSLPEGCVPLVQQPDGSYVADAVIDEGDPVEFFDYNAEFYPEWFVDLGSYTERFCGVFENYDRLVATALPGPAPALRNIIIKAGPGNYGFTSEEAYARTRVTLEADAPLGAPIVHEFLVGGIRSILDLGSVRLVVDVEERLCDYDPSEAPVYGEDGYIDARESGGFYGSYFPRASEGVELCAPEFRGETACVTGIVDSRGYFEIVQHVAQERGGEPQLWTPPPEYVGIGYEQQAGEPLGITDGETIWWSSNSNSYYNEIRWEDFKTGEGTSYAREPFPSVVQRPGATGRVSYCALTTEPLLAAGARPDCHQLTSGENHLLLYGDRYSVGLACFEAEEGQILTLEFIAAVPEFGVVHLGPESSYNGPALSTFSGSFSEATPRPTYVVTAAAGLNAFRISSAMPDTRENTPVVLNFTVTDP